MIVVLVLVCAYYTVIMAYSFLYIYHGFFSPLPWSNCGHDFNSYDCWSQVDQDKCQVHENLTFYNRSCVQMADFCHTMGLDTNGTACLTDNGTQVEINSKNFNFTDPAADFWNANILRLQVLQFRTMLPPLQD